MKKKIGDLTLREIADKRKVDACGVFSICSIFESCEYCVVGSSDINLDEEIEVQESDLHVVNTELALKLSKIVHDNCKDAPHDIGLILAEAIIGLGIEVKR